MTDCTISGIDLRDMTDCDDELLAAMLDDSEYARLTELVPCLAALMNPGQKSGL